MSRIETWYEAQCDSQWEHQFGVRIDTLDNPGWFVSIDLVDTKLENAAFTAVSQNRTERDWMVCRLKGSKFVGYGEPKNLEEILTVFVDWAELSGTKGKAPL